MLNIYRLYCTASLWGIWHFCHFANSRLPQTTGAAGAGAATCSSALQCLFLVATLAGQIPERSRQSWEMQRKPLRAQSWQYAHGG